jgi:VanZ family protein
LSIYGSLRSHNLDLAQSGSDLVVQGYFRSRNSKSEFHQLWMEQACSNSFPVFVTITSSEEGTVLNWIAGDRFAKQYAGLTPMNYVGRVLVGHGATKGAAWSGEVYGLAVYDRAIRTEEIAQHYAQWLAGNPALLGERALYAANDRDHIVHNRAGGAPDLVIPEQYWPLTPSILEIPRPFRHSDVLDSIVNILGFIPFGYFVMCYFRGAAHDVRDPFLRTTIIGLLTTLAIEILQVFLPSRDSSLLDVINNVIGSVAGAFLAAKYACSGYHLFGDFSTRAFSTGSGQVV